MIPDLDLILDAAEAGEPDAVRELASIVREAVAEPERTVAVAFGLREQALRSRNEAIGELPEFLPAGLKLAEQARTIMREYGRYRPATSEETDPKRRAYQRISDSGAPFPTSVKQLVRILKQAQ